jgi:hypothetical protein
MVPFKVVELASDFHCCSNCSSVFSVIWSGVSFVSKSFSRSLICHWISNPYNLTVWSCLSSLQADFNRKHGEVLDTCEDIVLKSEEKTHNGLPLKHNNFMTTYLPLVVEQLWTNFVFYGVD